MSLEIQIGDPEVWVSFGKAQLFFLIQTKVSSISFNFHPFPFFSLIEISTKTDSSLFSSNLLVVRRRIPDFAWLRKRLCETFPLILIPPFPSGSFFFERFKTR